MRKLIRDWLISWRLSRENVTYSSLPSFRGELWPRLEARNGKMIIGPETVFRCVRYRTQITADQGGTVDLGKGCFINQGVSIYSAKRITIGDYSGLSDHTTVFDTQFHPIDQGEETIIAPVPIGKNVWIGRGVMIMPGSSIGDHSVIGAHSVVWGDIPPKVVAVGFPARAVKALKCADDWIRLREP